MFDLILNSAALGVGLAMDAFSVSLTNGLAEPCGTRRRALSIAGIFALFQGVMPLLGWVLITAMAQQFHILNRFIPYIALGLLLFIGGSEIAQIQSVGGKTLDEAYYYRLQYVYHGFGVFVLSMGIFMSSVLTYLGIQYPKHETGTEYRS